MRRLCAALGTWQLVMLAAALRQEARERGYPEDEDASGTGDSLLLYGRAGLTPELRDLMPRIASATWPWERIVWVDDLIDTSMLHWEASGLRRGASRIRRMRQALRDRIGSGSDRVGQLWVSRLWGAPEKRLCEAFSTADVSYYEDGLHEYIAHPVNSWYSTYEILRPRMLARAIRHWLIGQHRLVALSRPEVIDAVHANRIRRAYLSIVEEVPPTPFLEGIPRSVIEHDLLRRAVSDASAVLIDWPRSEEVGDQPSVLVLGQCFWRWEVMERDDEIRANREAVRSLVDRGYRVLWKDHPRADPPLGEPVGEGLNTDQFSVVNLPQACPVELALDRLRVVAIASASSSSLFYAPKIGAVRAYQLRGPFEAMSGEFGEMIRLTSHVIEPIDALPSADSLKDLLF